MLPLKMFEYGVQLGFRRQRQGINNIEQVQLRTTIIPTVKNHSNSQRCKGMKLISLVQRILRGHLIEVFNYLKGFTTEQRM